MENEQRPAAPDLARQVAEAAETQPERVAPDLEPLGHDDVAAAVAAITVTREQLLDLLAAAGPGVLDRQERGGEGWTVRRALVHLAGGERFFLERLGLAECLPEQPPDADPLALIEDVRRQTLNDLSGLDEPWLTRTVERDGELWTLRKTLRRLQAHDAEHLARLRTILDKG